MPGRDDDPDGPDVKEGGRSKGKSKNKSKDRGSESLRETREEVEFQLPEFDEQSYIRKEIRDAKLALVTLAYAIAVAIVARSVQFALDNAVLAFLVGIVALLGIRPLFQAVGADLEEFEIKNWLGSGAVFFFAWLGFWTLLLNPPFA